jgi:glutamate racemase
MDQRALVERLRRVVAYLAERGVTHLVIGCNAASTALDELLLQPLPIPYVVGVIEPAVRLLARLRPERAALIGGRRTVLSGVHRRALARLGIPIRGRVAQPLSAFIESGDTASPALKAECRRILAPLRGASHLLLACTHYPAIAPLLASCLPEEVQLVDPAEALVEEILGLPRLPSADAHSIETGDTFLTTGDPEAMRRAAWNAFGVEIGQADRIDL